MTNRLLAFLSALIVTISLISGFTSLANAQSLGDLRTSGAVGERFDGYAVARDTGAKIFVDEVNAKRRLIYKEKAAAQGVSIDQVGRVFAQELFNRLPSGTWIQKEDGSWVHK